MHKKNGGEIPQTTIKKKKVKIIKKVVQLKGHNKRNNPLSKETSDYERLYLKYGII
jgi:hypothetical protein